MRLVTHVLLGGLLSMALFPLIGWNSLIVFISGFLIDIDHLLWYCIRFKGISLSRCHAYCERVNTDRNVAELKRALLVFHTVEFLVVVVALSFFVSWFVYVLIGVAWHLILDSVDRWRIFRSLGAYSLVLYLIRNRATKSFL